MRWQCLLVVLSFAGSALAQDKAKEPIKIRGTLPQDHPYQATIRQFLAGLTEKDFTHGVTGPLKAAGGDDDPEVQYRHYLFTLMNQPLVGTKRGVPAVNAPPALFLLSSLEHPDGVKIPPVFPEALIAFVHWKYPGNVYYNNRALKLRAFVKAAVNMVMMDDQLEHHPERGGARADWFGSQLIQMAHPYPGFKDVLPETVQKAYEQGLRRMGERVLEWGPEGEEPNLELVAVVGLWYVSQALRDADFSKKAEAYAHTLFADPRYFHPAGFFHDYRGIDMGYQGMTNFFASWTALATDWPFAKDAVDRCYRLRAHLGLPEPDGKYVGPSHFNSRTSSDAWGDQWEWGIARDVNASLATLEAVYLNKLPSADVLKSAGGQKAGDFNHQIAENPRNKMGRYIGNEEIQNSPWAWRLWQTFNFPATVNFGYELCPPDAYARRRKLEETNSPWLKSPFLRDESFQRDFAKAFTVARQPSYAAIVHSGPIGYQPLESGLHKFSGPLGFGGGQLSAFWTPATGSVILGRRGGNSWDKTFDLLEEWRTWPLHAVSGCKPDGKVFTSARIVQPTVESDVQPGGSQVRVSGVLPIAPFEQGKTLEGRLSFERVFRLDADQVKVETILQSTGQDQVAELYETIPLFLQESRRQKAAPTVIQFLVGDKWQPAATTFQEGVSAVKLSRFDGHAKIVFAQPQRVKLAPAVWSDSYLSGAKCHNLLIDLLDGTSTPQVVRGERKLSYRIAAASD